jgi:hypothetical protein
MKVENHDTTKLGNQHENLLKREIQTINVNKYKTLFNNVRTRVLYSLLIQQLLYVCYAYLLIYLYLFYLECDPPIFELYLFKKHLNHSITKNQKILWIRNGEHPPKCTQQVSLEYQRWLAERIIIA